MSPGGFCCVGRIVGVPRQPQERSTLGVSHLIPPQRKHLHAHRYKLSALACVSRKGTKERNFRTARENEHVNRTHPRRAGVAVQLSAAVASTRFPLSCRCSGVWKVAYLPNWHHNYVRRRRHTRSSGHPAAWDSQIKQAVATVSRRGSRLHLILIRVLFVFPFVIFHKRSIHTCDRSFKFLHYLGKEMRFGIGVLRDLNILSSVSCNRPSTICFAYPGTPP